MNRYETEVDLRRVVEKRIGKRVEDPHWEESGPQWTGPYDALDLEEILTRFKRCGSRKTRAQSSDSLEGATIQSSYESEERALICLQTVEEARLEHFGSTAIPFHDLPSVSQWIRHLWRTERPVPVGKIGSLGSCSACGKPAFFKDSGHDALFSNTTGADNIAIGYLAGQEITTGNNNIHIGHRGFNDSLVC